MFGGEINFKNQNKYDLLFEYTHHRYEEQNKKNRQNIQRKHGDHADALGLMPSENATTRVARHLCLIINAT